MAIIYSYPTATPKASDLLIGTVTYDGTSGTPVDGNPTRTFNIGDIANLLGGYTLSSQAAGVNANIVLTSSLGAITAVNLLRGNGISISDNGSNGITLGNTGVLSIVASNSTFVNSTPVLSATGNVTISSSLSAVGTPSSSNYLRGDNRWSTPVTTITTQDSQYINLTPNSSSNGAVTITAQLSAAGSPTSSNFLRGDNVWAVPAGEGVTQILAGTDISISPGGGTGIVTINSTSQGKVTSIVAGDNVTLSPISGLGDVTVSAPGLIPYVETSTASMQFVSEDVALGGGASSDTVLSSQLAIKTYVDNAVVGGLIYQGAYDAATNTPVLDSRGTQIAVTKGWTYTVTVDGTFYGETVKVGDVLIAEIDLVAGTGALTDWTTVQSNIDLATAGTTATAVRGLAGFDTDNFTVVNGFVNLKVVGTTYDYSSIQSGADVDLNLTPSSGTVDTVKLVAGSGISLTDDGSNNVTIATSSSSSIAKDDFVGDGTTVAFTLSVTPFSTLFTSVFIAGVYQEKETYSITGTTLTFTTAPPNLSSVEVMSVVVSNISPGANTITRNDFTGTGSQTDYTLTVAPSSINFVDVYISGTYQNKDTFTIVGTTLSFSEAPANSNEIEVIIISNVSLVQNEIVNYGVNTISASTTASKNNLYVLIADLTLTLPITPANGDSVKISNLSGVATCILGRNGSLIMGVASDLTLDTPSASFELVYSGATRGWVIVGL